MSKARLERVTKLMSERGLASRREAERLIAAGQVRVDGAVVREQGCKAARDAAIEITAEAAEQLGTRLTIALHKPIGVVSILPAAGQLPAWRLLRAENAAENVDRETLARVLERAPSLSVAGRLDRASRGLLVLTEDGTVARRIIGGHGVEKSYRVRTREPVTDAQIRKLGGPMTLDGRALRPMRVERLGEGTLRFALLEGRKHQIRRVCRKVGLTVLDLCREAIGPLRLGNLAAGKWRLASREEIEDLLRPSRAETRPEAHRTEVEER
jgi:23S rRNA pseudouridine2604 synthase